MLHLILGPPRSGLNILKSCLRLLGFYPPEHQLDATTINNLLFQDLGLSPYAIVLPRDWIHTQAAETARHRIRNLLQSMTPSDKNYAISDPLLCHTLPLWQQEINVSELDPRYIFIIRHPFEVALSLQANHGLDIHKAHILWLAHTRAAMRALERQSSEDGPRSSENGPQTSPLGTQKRSSDLLELAPCPLPLATVITFDQLLADPVSTINNALGSLLTSDIRPLTPDLLAFIQPSQKHHHAADLQDQDKETYKPYEEIYNQLRLSQYTAPAQQDASLFDPRSADQKRLVKIREDSWAKGSSPALIDNLLQALAQQEPTATFSSFQITDNRSQTTGLHAQITFPTSTSQGQITETVPLLEDQWQEISLSVPEPKLLSDSPIHIQPLNSQGFAYIGSFSLVSKTTGQTIWAFRRGNWENLNLQGTALKIPDKNNLCLLATGNTPQIELPAFTDIPDMPLDLIIWIKPCSDQAQLLNNFNVHWSRKPQKSNQTADSHDQIIMELNLILPDNRQMLVPFATNKPEYLRQEDNLLHFSIPDKEPLYLYSKENCNFSVPPGYNLFSLRPDTDYIISGHLQSNGKIMVWAIEYDHDKRLAHENVNLIDDSFEMFLRTQTRHDNLCLALRLYGNGTLDLKQHALHIQKINSDTLSLTLKKQVEELSHIKENLELKFSQGISNATKQIEAHLAIQHYLQTGRTMDQMHGWFVSPDIANYIIETLETVQYDLIIEFGSGTTTALMARVVQNKVYKGTLANDMKIISFEHLDKFHKQTLNRLKELKIEDKVDLILAPLESYIATNNKAYPFYACHEQLSKALQQFYMERMRIFVFVDGPPSSTGRHARYPALPILLDHFPGAQIDVLLDDYIRNDEKEIVNMWENDIKTKGMDYTREIQNFEKGACLISVKT